MKNLFTKTIAIAFCIAPLLHAQGLWKMGSDKNAITERHECSFVGVGDKFLLIGGRESKNVEAFDYATNTWTTKAASPILIHHYQAINYANIVTIVGASTGGCCAEPGIPDVYYYDPIGDLWVKGAPIPAARVRGTSGVVVYNDKFYQVCGNTRGHESGWKTWTDMWDPLTNKWTILPDAPHARDHFHAALYGGKIFAGGGRRSSNDIPGVGIFKDTEPKVDVFDIATSTWTTLPDPMPTQRGAPQTAVFGDEIFYYGGEGGPDGQPLTINGVHPQCEAVNVKTGKWKVYTQSPSPRHGTQVIVNNGGLYTADGHLASGGGGPTSTQLAFYPGGVETRPIPEVLTKGVLKTIGAVAYKKVGSSMDSLFVPITHESGTQGVLISSITLSNAGTAKIADSIIFPILLAPGRTFSLVLSAPSSPTLTAGTVTIKTAIPANGSFVIPFTTSTTVSIDRLMIQSKFGKSDPILERIQGGLQIRTSEDAPNLLPRFFDLSGRLLK